MTPRLRLLVALALILAIVFVYRLAGVRPYGETLAYTECPFWGEPRVTITSAVAAEDTQPVRVHEEVHASQCRRLGPFRYRRENLTTRGKLALEAPAYCAGARMRLTLRVDSAVVRERLIDDASAAFKGSTDPTALRAALRLYCPEIVR